MTGPKLSELRARFEEDEKRCIREHYAEDKEAMQQLLDDMIQKDIRIDMGSVSEALDQDLAYYTGGEGLKSPTVLDYMGLLPDTVHLGKEPVLVVVGTPQLHGNGKSAVMERMLGQIQDQGYKVIRVASVEEYERLYGSNKRMPRMPVFSERILKNGQHQGRLDVSGTWTKETVKALDKMVRDLSDRDLDFPWLAESEPAPKRDMKSLKKARPGELSRADKRLLRKQRGW